MKGGGARSSYENNETQHRNRELATACQFARKTLSAGDKTTTSDV